MVMYTIMVNDNNMCNIYEIIDYKKNKKTYRKKISIEHIDSSSEEEEFGKTRYDPDDYDSPSDLD